MTHSNGAGNRLQPGPITDVEGETQINPAPRESDSGVPAVQEAPPQIQMPQDEDRAPRASRLLPGSLTVCILAEQPARQAHLQELLREHTAVTVVAVADSVSSFLMQYRQHRPSVIVFHLSPLTPLMVEIFARMEAVLMFPPALIGIVETPEERATLEQALGILPVPGEALTQERLFLALAGVPERAVDPRAAGALKSNGRPPSPTRRGGKSVSGLRKREMSVPPKGISLPTLRVVHQLLKDQKRDDISAAELSEIIGMSRVSIRRYLAYLVAEGEATIRPQYGNTGRPEHRFQASKRGATRTDPPQNAQGTGAL